MKTAPAGLFGVPVDTPEERAACVVGDAGCVEICAEIEFKVMVARHFVVLAAFFMEADPKTVLFWEHVPDVHGKRGPDAGEGVGHKGNQSAVAEVREAVG